MRDASGLLISRPVAKQAGLTSSDTAEVGGIGDEGDKSAYTAYLDSIRIGSLEFRDCAVTVLESRSVNGEDGLIGMDLFSNLLVTLDYLMHKIVLAALPPRPQDDSNNRPSLTTSTEQPAGPQDRFIAPSMNDWTKVYRAGHQLLIPAALNRSKINLFILDTGALERSRSRWRTLRVLVTGRSGERKSRILCGSQGGPCDPTSKSDAGGTPAS